MSSGGRILAGADRNITFTGATLQIGTELPGAVPTAAGLLTLQTTGTGLLTMQTGSILDFDLFSGAGQGDNTGIVASADRAIILGGVDLSSSTILKVANPTGMTTWAANDQWRLFDWTGLSGPVSGSIAAFDLPSLPDGLTWNTADLLTSGVLSISLVPEPSRVIFLVFGAMSLLSRRRR
ncbi:PEP-CTERM sorting domain-containing protein [Prosthecobacter dejongeii]|uniref:PEP-CTERM protein-sorting domain-containing protein n=1 Tax=Prosthecobacter dejongeii TaxID=48465 RepID=A0A7W8DPP9_9BACT|nr:PEP-CTERM sorting domain-containing protein [Prosthecobacter dejongeii]MBB5037146.1 hypothetical protein [Prosthecobacter dejongeii]